jgi:hypothetical protein
MPDSVLVSCLMVTLASEERRDLTHRSIADYCAQAHPLCELVVVTDPRARAASAALAAHIAALDRSDIRMIEPAGPLSLGALRNLSRASAAGDVHCQWDDDDRHHPSRVDRQLAALLDCEADAIGLQDVMQFFPATRSLFWTNWRATAHTVHPGTVMVRASASARYPESGPDAELGEDSAFCQQLLGSNALRGLADAPHLSVYMSHGANTFDDRHHGMLAAKLGLSQGLLRRREARIRQFLQPFDFGPGPIHVCGPNGVAFVIDR